jgi:protein TonB
MTYNVWYKAFSVSCVIHLFMILLLAMFIKNIDPPQLPEGQIVIEFTEVSVSNSQDSGPAAVRNGSITENAVPFSANVAPVPGKIAAAQSVVSSRQTRQAMADSEHASMRVLSDDASGDGEESAVQSMANTRTEAAAGLQPAGNAAIDSIINDFLSQVEKRKEYPYIARRRGQEGTVTVAVRLNAAGELTGAQVIRSSGVAALDEAALALVRRVCPFTHNAGRTIGMNIPIAYQLE